MNARHSLRAFLVLAAVAMPAQSIAQEAEQDTSQVKTISELLERVKTARGKSPDRERHDPWPLTKEAADAADKRQQERHQARATDASLRASIDSCGKDETTRSCLESIGFSCRCMWWDDCRAVDQVWMCEVNLGDGRLGQVDVVRVDGYWSRSQLTFERAN